MRKICPRTYLEAAELGCVFCSPSPSLIFATSENFQVLYDPFALVPGHLLIVSKEHIPCLGYLPMPLIKEFKKVSALVKGQLENFFGSAIVYEHGSVGHCFSHKLEYRSCLHFHQHVLPANVDIHSQLEARYRSYRIKDESEIPALADKYCNYLYFENANGERKFYATDNESVPSHFLRTLIATELGTPSKQNWEEYKDCESFIIGKSILENKDSCLVPSKRLLKTTSTNNGVVSKKRLLKTTSKG